MSSYQLVVADVPFLSARVVGPDGEMLVIVGERAAETVQLPD